MKRQRQHRRARRGNILVLSAVLMVPMMGALAFAIDLGYLYNTRTEMQRTADAAAVAATWELIDENVVKGVSNSTQIASNARAKASQYASLNAIGGTAAQLGTDDVQMGYIASPWDPTSPFLTTGYSAAPNAVRVKVLRNSSRNGAIPLFFAPVLGVNSASLQIEATAAYVPGLGGFKPPTDGSNLGILPFALDEDTWNAMLAGGGDDSYSYSHGSSSVGTGGDGVREVNLFPQGTGSPGNRGTVDIGSSNNSTADIARQITSGINASDMAHMGGSITFGADGTLHLNGDTGISAGVKDELTSIVGKTRFIPIFRSVVGPGNNADYTIVKWVGVRVLAVKLTGSASSKYVMVQ